MTWCCLVLNVDRIHGQLGATHRAAIILIHRDHIVGINLGGWSRHHPDQRHRNLPDHYPKQEGKDEVDDGVAGHRIRLQATIAFDPEATYARAI